MYKLLQKLKQAEQLYDYSRTITGNLYDRTLELEQELDKRFIENKLYFKMSELRLLTGHVIYNISLAIDDTILGFEFVDGCTIQDGYILSTGKSEELKWNGTEYEGWLADDFNKALGWCDVEVKYENDYLTLDWTTRENLIKYADKGVSISPDYVCVNYKYIQPMKYDYDKTWEENRMKFKVYSTGVKLSDVEVQKEFLRGIEC